MQLYTPKRVTLQIVIKFAASSSSSSSAAAAAAGALNVAAYSTVL